ncbi:MAG: pilus assembly protein [Bdellovibrionales bacterium]|nr:pilus assembly protein [Bdellovibrionales bacterium]
MRTRRKNRQRGQVIIEFLLVFVMFTTLIFSLVQICWGLAFGHYSQYATFMAARAYMAGGTTRQDQQKAAEDVLKSMVKNAAGNDLVPFLARARTGDDRDIAAGPEPVPGAFIGTHPRADGLMNRRGYAWAEGVQYNFDVPLYLVPLSSFARDGQGESISVGSGSDGLKPVTWRGGIPFTSDAWLGREESNAECLQEMNRLRGMPWARQDGQPLIEDNGC